MSRVVGIDIGTSGVKAVLIEDDRALAEANRKLAVSVPHPGWSEQHPDLWVDAVFACLDELSADGRLSEIRAIGLSGQMLGAVLLDRALKPVRPAILWNDQRAIDECALLLERVPDIGYRTNGAPDPGITAPKLLWLARHEPDCLDRASLLMLPKDYVRLALTGDVASEPTDAGGTELFDVAAGRWDAGLCAAAGWDEARLPAVIDTWQAAGTVRAALAARWGFRHTVTLAAGAGDNMAATIGVGAARPGDGVITIGTSGVACLVDGAFHPAPGKAVLTSAHAAPGTFLSMGVVMSATASLDWVARLTGKPAADLAGMAETVMQEDRIGDAPLFLPALTGIRTPLGQPDMTGRIHGLHPSTDPAGLAWATLEGVAFQIADCVEAQTGAGVPLERLAIVGGGARSRLWVTMIASLLDRPAGLPAMAPVAAALGAGRLARVAAGLDDPTALSAPMPAMPDTIAPDPALARRLGERRLRFRDLLPEEGERP